MMAPGPQMAPRLLALTLVRLTPPLLSILSPVTTAAATATATAAGAGPASDSAPSPPTAPGRPIPPPSTQLAWNYSLPYSIYYNDAGNYPPNVYDPGNASQYGFITDDVAHHHGTAAFSQVEEDPLWPNFVYTSGADNVSYLPGDCEKNKGVRHESPLGVLCCAQGGCVPQEADLSAIAAMAARHAEAIVPPDMAGM